MNPYVSAYKKNQDLNRRQRRRSIFSGGALVLFILFLVSFVLVGKRTLGQQILIEVQALKAERRMLITAQSVYMGQKQEYLSRERIIEYAREKLGLDFPDPSQVMWVRVQQHESGILSASPKSR